MESVNWNTVLLFGIAVFQAITALYNYLTKNVAIETRNIAQATHVVAVETKQNVEIIEKATNSLQAIALTKTGEAAFAAGQDKERIAGEAKAATLAQGVKQAESAAIIAELKKTE